MNNTEKTTDIVETENKKTSRFSWKNNRKLRLGTTATVFTAVVIAAVIVFNVIVGIFYDRFPLSLDLTTDSTYTMSEQARAVAKNVSTIENDIEIIVFLNETYFSSPSLSTDELNIVLRQFHLFSKEYNALSNGKVKVTYLDPTADPTILDKYSEYNVESGSILFRCGQQSRVRNVENLYELSYDSSYYDYVYYSRVEEVLSSTVNSICGGKTVTVTFLTGHGEDTDLISEMSSLYQLNGYATETIDFTTAAADEIDETSEILVIAAPSLNYSLDEISKIREWLKNDGNYDRNLFVLCNYACKPDTETNRINLYDFLETDYGITVTDNVIVETDSNNHVSGTNGEYYPLTLMEQTDLTGGTGLLLMPYTLQLKLKHESDPAATGVGNVPLAIFEDSAELVKVEDLGEKKDSKETDDDVIGMAYAVEAHGGTLANHIIVSGSYQFPYSMFTSRPEYTNEELMLEPVRVTCDLGESMALSNKDLTTPTLSFTEADAQIINIFLICAPLLLIVISVVIFLRRRHL